MINSHIIWPINLKINKYVFWYEKLVLNAKQRILPKDTYTENHHIIPSCMTKNNSAENIVTLTAREHYIAHLLLWRMSMPPKWHNKMMMALHVMVNGSGHNRQKTERASYIVPSRLFDVYRKEWALYMSETNKGEDNHFYGKKHSAEAIEKIKNANVRTKDIRSKKFRGENNPMWGKTHTAETKALLSKNIASAWTDEMKLKKSEEVKLKWQNEDYRTNQIEKRKQRWAIMPQEERKRIGQKALEKKIANGNNSRTVEQRAKMSLAARARPPRKGKPANRVVCLHCSKQIGGEGNYARWHGDNCKEKK
jgi:hypothetical protein